MNTKQFENNNRVKCTACDGSGYHEVSKSEHRVKRMGRLVFNIEHLKPGDYCFIKEYKIKKPRSTVVVPHPHTTRSIRIHTVNVKYGLVRYELADCGFREMGAFNQQYLNNNGPERIILTYMDD